MTGIRAWLLSGINDRSLQHAGPGAKPAADRRHPWWQVMCLTGVDYFSTLGYQPGIAALAAGRAVARGHPGAGRWSRCSARCRSTGGWPRRARTARAPSRCWSGCCRSGSGKLFVLVLLGFAATDFMITMTLSAADATAHLVENPLWPAAGCTATRSRSRWSCWRCSAAVFLAGSPRPSASPSSWSGVYLALNVVVVVDGLWQIATHPVVVDRLVGRR